MKATNAILKSECILLSHPLLEITSLPYVFTNPSARHDKFYLSNLYTRDYMQCLILKEREDDIQTFLAHRYLPDSFV